MGSNIKTVGSKDIKFQVTGVNELASYPPHAHLFYEIGFFAKGSGVLQINDKKFNVKAPCLHFCPPTPAWHAFHSTKTKFHTGSIAVYPKFLFGDKAPDEMENSNSPTTLLEYLANRKRPIVKLTPTSAAHVERIINLLREENRVGMPGNMMIISGYVQQLLVLANREESGINIRAWQPLGRNVLNTEKFGKLDTVNKHPNPPLVIHDSRIEKVLSLMRRYIKEPRSNNELAYSVNMDEKYFIHFFTKEVGVSPQRYYLRLRLEAAAHYLVSTDLTIKEIARLHGFKHRTHFQAAFRRFFKSSPDTYRYMNSAKD